MTRVTLKLVLLLLLAPCLAFAQPYNHLTWTESTTVSVARLQNLETGIEHGFLTDYDDLYVRGGYSSTTRVTVTADLVGVTNGTTHTYATAVNLVLAPTSGARQLLGQDGTWVAATNTFYAVYLIMKADGTKSLVSSPSFTAPDLSDATFAGYIFYRLVSVFRNEATGSYTIRPYDQRGSIARYHARLQVLSGGASSPGSQSLAALVPTSISTVAFLSYLQVLNAAGAESNTFTFRTQSQTGQDYHESTIINPSGGEAAAESGTLTYWNDGTLYYNSTNANSTVTVWVTGFTIDALAR